MAYTTIDDPSAYFNTVLYTGNGSTQTISGVGFQPNLTWIKHRDGATAHMIFDSVRGALYRLQSNSSNGETSAANTLTAWNSDGFALGTENDTNGNTRLFASWNWIESATAGFDIVAYTGNATNRTISHSCGSAVKMIITKSRAGNNWFVYHESISNTDMIKLNQTNAKETKAAIWNSTSPTSSVFSLGTDNDANENGINFIAYCFAEKQGYSKFGSYIGNGATDGTFVWTGQKSAFIMIKAASRAGTWNMYDVKRNTFNNIDDFITANTSDAETTGNTYQNIDILSNGFKCRGTGTGTNESGSTYIYMAFAENPFVTSTGVPATAR